MKRNLRLNSILKQFHKTIVNPESNDAPLEDYLVSDSGISVKRRLEIYQKGYYLRLLECMKSEYPLMRQVFSDSWFESMALRFLESTPSTSTNLNDLSASFPAFLQRDRPDRDLHIKDNTFELIVALALFERAKIETARSRGSEHCLNKLLSKIEFEGESFNSMRIAENVRLMSVNLNLLKFLENECVAEESLFSGAPQYIVVSRRYYSVTYCSVPEWQYVLLDKLSGGSSYRSAVAQVAEQYSTLNIDVHLPHFLSFMVSNGVFVDESL